MAYMLTSSSNPTPGSTEMAKILQLLQPTAHRLNHLLKPRPALEVQDLANLAELCAFDSQAYGTDFSSWSDWCRLFDRDEWDVLGYAKEVGRWYQVGQGSVSSSSGYPMSIVADDSADVWTDDGC